MLIAYHESYAHPVPPGHRFPMQKYIRVYESLNALYPEIISSIIQPQLCDYDIIKLAHDEFYIHQLKENLLTKLEARRIGFNMDEAILQRERYIMQGTLELALKAIKNNSWGFNIAGGTHHAMRDRGEGFCIFNDFAVAGQYLLENNLCERILIIDCDVHQGNGTAQIFRNNSQVFTFSIHGKNNFPFEKEISDLDIEVDDGTEDETYLSYLEHSLIFIEKIFHPDIIFYQCGVDILSTDKMGKLKVTSEGCAIRDTKVFNFAKKLNVPIVSALGGGYSEDLDVIVQQHLKTILIAHEIELVR